MRIFAATAIAFATLVTASTSFAAGLEPTRISLPKGPGSIEGLGRNFAPSLASGTASYGVDIAVPPSAGGFAPHVGLDYDSGGGVSDIGMGWKLGGIPSVRRRTENGLPKFDATDAFEISGLGIACDLLEITPGTFRPEYESGAFVRVQRSTSGWEARDKSGTTYRFGGDGFTEAEGGNVATWLLSEQLDVHGHSIKYTWDASSGHALLQRVTWNDYGDDARNVVTFTYEDRPDPHVLFSVGIKQGITKRLTTVEVKHGGALVRRYELGYTPGTHSRLATVDLVGRDGTSRLPRLSLGYTTPSFAADGQIVTMTTPPGRTPADPNIEISDLDGDGLPDLLVTLAGQYRSYQNHDGTAWKPGVDWDASVSPSMQLGSTGVQLADLDGDGAIDLVAKSGTSDFRYFPGNTTTSFRAPVQIATVPNVTFEDPDVKLVDMDGDRRIDVLVTTAAGIAIGYNKDGVDWTVPAVIGVVDSRQQLRFSDGGHTQLCDVNGDHVSDLCYLTPQSLAYWLGRGRGRFEPAQSATGVPNWDPSSPWELHDLDGDGWVDLVHVGVDQVQYALAIGAGKFDAVKSIGGTPTKGPNATVRFADMNGSGTVDIVWIDVSGDPAQAWRYLEIFPNGRGGLLQRIDNGLGKIETMTYGAAAADAALARNAGKPWTSRMNVAMSVVKRTEVDVSLGDPIMAVEYEYRDGSWSPLERTFAGFAGGTDRNLGDEFTPTLVEESTFDVGLDDRTQRGLVLSIEKRDASGAIFSRSIDTYTSRTLVTALNGRSTHYTYKTSEQTTHIEGGDPANGRVTLTEYEQDDYGNVTTERQWGEIVRTNKLFGNDEAITIRTFANNTQDWIFGHIATEEIQDGVGRRVRLKRFSYDGAPFVGLPLGELARGDLTRAEEWVGPGQDQFELAVGTSYDSDGNPTETRDARGGGHLFEWDLHDHTTLLAESVKLDAGVFTERAEFDRSFGVLLKGVHYNGRETTLGLDPFGRPLWIARPGDSAQQPTVRYGYLVSAPLSRVTEEHRIWSGRDDVERSEQLVDGAGRKRGFLVADDGGRWVLSAVALLDARGDARRKLHPRFVTAAEHDAPQLHADGPGADEWRDALGRMTRTRSQLGIEGWTAFAPFVTKHWDGGQTAKDSPYEHTPVVDTRDGLGRVVSNSQTLKGASFQAQFAFDPAGSLLSKIDPEGNVSRYSYDGRGRRITADDPDLGKHAYVYDATGSLIEHHRPDGVISRYTRDLAGRELTIDWDGDGAPEVTHTWDRSDRYPGSPLYAGALVKMTDPSGQTENEYDERGRLTAVHITIGGTTFDMARAFDAQDREYWHQYPDQSSIRVHRNARGLVSAYGKAITFDYESDSSEVRRSFNTGVVQATGYDDDRRPNETRALASGGAVIADLKWTYDGASNVLSVTDARLGVDASRDRSEQYTYDNLYRLESTKGTWGDAHWTYSPSGNLLTRTSTVIALNAGTSEYGKGAGPHAITKFKDRAVSYDAGGRMLDDGDRTYTWDARDQLVQVSSKSGASVENTFDGTGMRRMRTERAADGQTHTTRFIDDSCESRDGKLVRFIVHGGRRIAKLSDTNGVGVSGGAVATSDGAAEPPGRATTRVASVVGINASTALISLAMIGAVAWRFRRRAWNGLQVALPALGLMFVVLGCSAHPADGPPSILDGTIQTLTDADDLVFSDAIGSLSEQTTGSGTPKTSFAAYPFGIARYDDGSVETRKFANSPRDNDIGLDQMGVRSYAPELAVWVSGDPLALASPERGIGLPFATSNPYTYSRASPLTFVDPTGKAEECVNGVCRSFVAPQDDPTSQSTRPNAGECSAGGCVTVSPSTDTLRQIAAAQQHNAAQRTAASDKPLEKPLVDPIDLIPTPGTVAKIGLKVGGRLIGKAIVKAEGKAIATGVAKGAIGATGKVGEQYLKGLGGKSQAFFSTSRGARYVDQLIGGIAHESKVGYTSLTKSISNQIAKDAELMVKKKIQGSVWHFFTSPVTGMGGPSEPLRQALGKAGIGIVIH